MSEFPSFLRLDNILLYTYFAYPFICWQALGHFYILAFVSNAAMNVSVQISLWGPDCWRIDAFELWCWRRLLKVPWTARRSKQSILKISPGCSLEGLMLKLKLQYFGHLMRRADSFEKTLMLWKIEVGRRRRWQDEMVGWHHWLNGHEFEHALEIDGGQGGQACSSPWDPEESDMTKWLN